MQERRNSIANALELRLSCTNPSICKVGPWWNLSLLQSKQSQMNSLLDEQSAQQRDSEKAEEERRRQTLLRQQQESNVVEQLKAIVTEKEAKVKKLTEEINNMRITVRLVRMFIFQSQCLQIWKISTSTCWVYLRKHGYNEIVHVYL